MADKAVRLHDLDYPLEAGQYVQNGIVYQAVAERDLTPDEARAEVEAFMGEGWTHYVGKNDDETWVKSTHGYVTLFGCAPTLRPVVDALKASWRDAVRPWVIAGVKAGHENVADNGDDLLELPATIVARVLKEEDG